MRIFFKSLVRSYKIVLSPFLGGQCRFEPTCSAYALEALDRYSVTKALAKITKRLCSCHPFHPGGFDPA